MSKNICLLIGNDFLIVYDYASGSDLNLELLQTCTITCFTKLSIFSPSSFHREDASCLGKKSSFNRNTKIQKYSCSIIKHNFIEPLTIPFDCGSSWIFLAISYSNLYLSKHGNNYDVEQYNWNADLYIEKICCIPVIVLSILLRLVYFPCYLGCHTDSCLTKIEIKVQVFLL